MIIFQKTKKIGTRSFLVFTNEGGSTIDIPVDDYVQNLFLHYFDRLSPGLKPVENGSAKDSEDS